MMRFPLTALTTAAVLMLAGCGLGDAETPANSPAASASGGITGKVSLQTWSLKPKFTDYVQGVIDSFEKKYPGAEVEWLDQPGEGYSDKVLSQAAGGTLPDVTNVPPDFALPLARQGMLADIAKTDAGAMADYVEGGLAAYRFAGIDGVFGYPWYLNTDVNYWNSELMKKYGLDPAKPPANLDELIAQARTMKEKSGGKVYLMSRKPELGDLINAGVKLMSDDGKSFTFNTPEAVAVLDRYRAAFEEGLLPKDVLTDDYAGNAKLFTQGKAAWTTAGGNFISSLAVDNPSMAPKVVSSKAFGIPPLYVQGLSVSAKTKNLAAATALARWVTSPENQAAFAHLTAIFPSTKASATDPFFSKSDGSNGGDAKVTAFSSLPEAKMLPVEVGDSINKVVRQQFALAISGGATSRQAVDAAVAKANELLQQ
ncbi:ABC transporter substrate-binding protein [Nonomuraea typhae]|uniref:ABC transporter substrate-binding protein n=1 Tax=Nonomuraea typhae TaxID=2603600 RepID=UPI001FE26270|nr:extracellular solute-binding protein [Nonomuraea typhae]